MTERLVRMVVGFVVLVSLRSAPAAATTATATDVDPDFPPRVVRTEPADRERAVDFTLQEIKVTFDRPMTTGASWSWIIHPDLGVFPGYRGSPDPRWENDGRTCVLAVKLSPDTVYAVGVNSIRHTGFRSADGKVAVPHVWVFKTRKGQQ